jgi:hypothetical protein
VSRLLILGQGYAAGVVARRLAARGWQVTGTTRDGRGGTLAFDGGVASAALVEALSRATHVLSSVPPDGDADPVLATLADWLPGRWLGYLSSTGVYGDTAGAWVDEGAPVGGGRRRARAAADAAWLALGARVLRLPGIYGPGRSPLDRVRAGTAHRVDQPGQVFSRIHVDDLADAALAALDAPAGAYNIADDLPAAQNAVVEEAARLLGLAPPPLVPLASLSPMARGFHAENRRVANGKAKRVLGWAPRHADYRAGLRALNAMTSPTPVSTAPAPASADQR